APGSWMWVATAAMRSEFDYVLARGLPARRAWSVPDVMSAWSTFAHVVEAAGPLGPALSLRCSDPDDQKFIDLAMSRGDCHLVTRDKALLKLARRAAQRRSVRVCTPAAWNEERARAQGAPGR